MPYLHVHFTDHKYVTLYSDVLDEIRETYSVAEPGARFSRSRFAPKRYYPITPTGMCPIGFASFILQHALKTYPNIKIDIQPAAARVIKPTLAKNYDLQIPKGFDGLRDYQQHAVESCIKHGRGIIEHPTSAGKTPLMGSLILTLIPLVPNQIVVLVPDPGLAKQTYNEFVKFGIKDMYLWYKETEDDTDLTQPKVIVAHMKLITRRRDVVKRLLSSASVLIVDECHSLKRGNEINKIVDAFKTPNRFGLTGTLPDDIDSQWSMFGKLGPVIAREEAHVLSSRGFIADVVALRVCIHYANSPPINYSDKDNALENLRKEVDWLSEQSYRIDIIGKLASNAPSNTLILVDRISIGQKIVDEIKNKYPHKQVVFVNGSVDLEIREQIKKLIEANTNVICVAMMQIFRQGIDISNLHYLILAAIGKAKGRLIQSIGRGRRLHPNKTKLFLFDIVDMIGYCIQHGDSRFAVLQQQQIAVTEKHFYERPA